MKKQLFTIGLVLSLVLHSKPAQSQIPLPIVPAICATGAGCVLLGVVAVAGLSYYLWQKNHRHVLAYLNGTVYKIYNGGTPEYKNIQAKDQRQAQKICQSIANGRIFQADGCVLN